MVPTRAPTDSFQPRPRPVGRTRQRWRHAGPKAAVFGGTRQWLPRNRKARRSIARAKRDRVVRDPETDVAPGLPEAAIRVQNIDAQCVLQFTLLGNDNFS